VIKKEDSYGSNSGNGSWKGMIALVISGNADIGVAPFLLTKERSEVVDFTESLGFIR
jgi:ABC-type amino acid transport substrate-binding protein